MDNERQDFPVNSQGPNETEYTAGKSQNNEGEYSLKYINGVPNAPGYSASEYLPPKQQTYTPPTYSAYDGQRSNYTPPSYSQHHQSNQYEAPRYSAYGQNQGYSEPVYRAQTQQEIEREERKSRRKQAFANAKAKAKQIASGKTFQKAVACVLLVAICAGVSALTSYLVVSSMNKNSGNSVSVNFGQGSGNANNSTNTNYVTGQAISPTAIYEMGCEQVVGISIMVETNIFGQTSSSAVSGSGFIISEDGYILTNYHVVEYSAVYGYDITVILGSGDEYKAKLVGYDEDNDVALLKIEANGLNSVTFGSSEMMQVGENAYIIGNPLGELAYSMTSGIISALDREITVENGVAINMFQTNAAVNSGNSGGPVYNAKGEVIGIVTAKYADTGVEGLGFAIPIDDAAYIAEQILKYGYVKGKAYLGVSVVDSSRVGTTNNSYGGFFGWGSQQSNGLPDGAYVHSVESGSCAEKAGIKTGDIIIAIGDYKINSVSDLTTVLRRELRAGDSGIVTVWRGGEELKLEVLFDEYVPKTNN